MNPLGQNRLKAARAAQVATSKQIAALEAERRDALLADDDTRAAAVDSELLAQRLLAQRHVDKIALLGVACVAEEQLRQLPQTLDGLRARVAELSQQQKILARKPKRDRSAAEDSDEQAILGQLNLLGQHIAIMERMQ